MHTKEDNPSLVHHIEDGKRIPFIYSFDQVNETVFSRIGGKAVNLVKLRKAGLPVPPGYCITTDAYDYYIENCKIPDGLVAEITEIKSTLGGKIAIRSSANCEDDTQLSMAGVFQSRYVYGDEEISEAIEQIFKQSRSKEVEEFMRLHGKSIQEVKMGLVVQELVEPETAGVIYTRVNGDGLLVQYVDGFGANLVDGKTRGSTILLGKNHTILQSTGYETRPLSPNVVNQLVNYSQTIENLFPGYPLDIEFAFRDGHIYILQTRPLTIDLGTVELSESPVDTLEATKRNLRQMIVQEKKELGTNQVIFSDWNSSELLPKPTEMDIGIHMYVWGGSDNIPGSTQLGRREVGYQIGNEAVGVTKYIGGKAYLSIGHYAGLYHMGIPETNKEYYSSLVNEYLDEIRRNPQKGTYPQMGLFLQDPTIEDLRIRFGDRAEEYFQIYLKFSDRLREHANNFISEFYNDQLAEVNGFVKDMQNVDLQRMTKEELLSHSFGILEHVRTRSYVDFVKSARLGFYYSQRVQDLLQQKLGVSQDEAKVIFTTLNKGLDTSAVTKANIAIAEALSDEEAFEIAREYVGHYSTEGEMLEIRHPRLRDSQSALRAYVRGIRHVRTYREKFENQKNERLHIQQALLAKIDPAERQELERAIQYSQTYMALRETTKFLFTKEYLLLRDTLEILGERLGLESGDIYYAYPRELTRLVTDTSSMLHIIRARRQAFKNYEQLEMPHVILESDIDKLGFLKEDNTVFTEAAGNFLAAGEVVEDGVVVNLDEFEKLEDAIQTMDKYREQNMPIILAARQLSLIHDPLIVQATGLSIENCGIVAHGAQRARELGIGAIGGVRSKVLRTGMRVTFDPKKKLIRNLNN